MPLMAFVIAVHIGDFNVHVEDQSDIYASRFVEVLYDLDIVQNVHNPTQVHGGPTCEFYKEFVNIFQRLTSISASPVITLDLVLTQVDYEIRNLVIYPPNQISDHSLLKSEFQFTSRQVRATSCSLTSACPYNNSHVLNSLLPSTNTRTYNLRQRAHSRTLVAKTSTLTESDFIFRMLHKGVY